MFEYQVEYFDRDTETDKVIPFGVGFEKAKREAKKLSDRQDGVAYVVASRDGEATGHIVYVFGQQSEKEGVLK